MAYIPPAGFTYHTVHEADVEEVYQFCERNFIAEWQFCIGPDLPFPTREGMLRNIEVGNPFVLSRKDGIMQGFIILDRNTGKWLWGLGHRDSWSNEAIAADPEGTTERFAHLTAHAWAQMETAIVEQIPEVTDQNVSHHLNASLVRAGEVYRELMNNDL